jgi:hypothetical protein
MTSLRSDIAGQKAHLAHEHHQSFWFLMKHILPGFQKTEIKYTDTYKSQRYGRNFDKKYVVF